MKATMNSQKPGFGRLQPWQVARKPISNLPTEPPHPGNTKYPPPIESPLADSSVEQARSRLLAVLPTLAEDSFEAWTERWLSVLADILGADQLVFYQAEGPDEQRVLRAAGGFAAPLSELTQLVPVGEGLVGQVARSAKPRYFAQDPCAEEGQQFWCRSGLGTLKLRYLLLHPLCYQGRLQGLIEVAARQPILQERQALLSELSFSLSAALSGALQQQELRHLYLESQAQAKQLSDQEAEIRASLEQLQATQQQLIQAEKRAGLGQLVAGIAHEINTPIGAIKASAGLLDEELPKAVTLFAQLILQIQPQQIALLMQMVNLAIAKRHQLPTKAERKLRRELTGYFAASGYDNPEHLARCVVDAGLQEHLADLQALGADGSFLFVLEVMQLLGNLRLQIENISQSADRTDRIVSSLRSFAQQDDQHAARPIDLNKAILRCVEAVKSRLQTCETSLELDLSPNLPDCIGFEAELDQVWANLINNAHHAMGCSGKLTLRTYVTYGIANSQTLHIEVIDNGHGIPAHVQERIFEPFFSTKGAGEGTGLGLHLCRQIVERHGGSINFHSQPGHTVFTVMLPVGR